MRSLPRLTCVATALLLGGLDPAFAADTATVAVVVNAQFSSRTSLRVSSELLQFDVAKPDSAAVATVDFSAAARTQAGAEVLLSVEPLHGVQGPGGAGDIESSMAFTGEGAGTLSGVVAATGPTVAARWIGSGLRSGRLLFSLRTAATGAYTVPVRFVLSAP